MALENSGELEATNLLLYIILTIDETPVKVGIQKQIRKYLVQVLKIGFGKLQLN